jgi:hypothetical protein
VKGKEEMNSKIEPNDAIITHQYKMTTPIPAGVIMPDRVETRLGTLRFFDGLPDEATVQMVHDNLDFQRAVQAFLNSLPVVSLHALRSAIRTCGPDNQTVLISESLLDSRSLFFGAGNTETLYTIGWLDTKEGPLVIEVAPQTLGMINDFWGRYVTDLGRVGPDRGAGGKYLLIPPGYTGFIPDGYFVLTSRSYGNAYFIRGFLPDGDPQPAVENTKQHFRVYPLECAAEKPAMTFVNFSGTDICTIPASDASFFENLATVVQEEPLDIIDPETRGLLAAIGIRKGTPFAPNQRMQSILAEAAAVGSATGRTLLYSTRDPGVYYYPNSAWKMSWTGNDYQFSPGGILDLDSRARYFFLAWGVSPAVSVKMVGAGSQYALTERDAAGQYLDGGKTYRLHLPPNIPAKDFWSLVVYDTQTRSLLQTDQRFPSVSSQKKDLFINPDTSVDVYFGPEPPLGKESNWIQTIPGKSWWTYLRLYGPLEPWFDQTWRPGEIEPID